MKLMVKVLDAILIEILWVCHLVYQKIVPKKKEAINSSTNPTAEKRHFIHLYHTTSPNGHPECYMDVYQMYSPSDEKMLRAVCAKGVPNSTYWKYRRGNDYRRGKYVPKNFFEYSTIAL